MLATGLGSALLQIRAHYKAQNDERLKGHF
jgi:hypothetical protein